MKTECNVARDLMPLVLDGAASEESGALVREHIAECSSCADYLSGMQSALSVGPKQDERERQEFDKAARRLRAKRRLRIWRNVLVGVMAGVVLALGGAVGWSKLTQEFNTLVYYGEYGIDLSQLADGRAVVNVDFRGSSTWMAVDMLEEHDMDGQNVLYVNLKRTRIRHLLESPNVNYSCGRLSRDSLLQYSEIRQGVPEEYCVVWRNNQYRVFSSHRNGR